MTRCSAKVTAGVQVVPGLSCSSATSWAKPNSPEPPFCVCKVRVVCGGRLERLVSSCVCKATAQHLAHRRPSARPAVVDPHPAAAPGSRLSWLRGQLVCIFHLGPFLLPESSAHLLTQQAFAAADPPPEPLPLPRLSPEASAQPLAPNTAVPLQTSWLATTPGTSAASRGCGILGLGRWGRGRESMLGR